MGRKSDKRLQVWVDHPRLHRWREAAAAEGRELSGWVRLHLDRAARQHDDLAPPDRTAALRAALRSSFDLGEGE